MGWSPNKGVRHPCRQLGRAKKGRNQDHEEEMLTHEQGGLPVNPRAQDGGFLSHDAGHRHVFKAVELLGGPHPFWSSQVLAQPRALALEKNEQVLSHRSALTHFLNMLRKTR